jgi:diguanylate cyclase (GGDEF)-like protein
MSRPAALALVAAGLLATFVLDRQTDAAPVQHLYYLPIILASFRLRWVGGLVTSLIAVVLYHIANPSLLTFTYHEADLVQTLLFIAVGLVTARLAENARQLHVIAMTDDLTGLHNLRSFERRLKPMLEAARLGGGSLSMMVLDLDKLKSLNDTHGHLTGAEAVRLVGHILHDELPEDALACRYGGDEFVISLASRTDEEMRALAAHLCEAVRKAAPTLAGRRFPAGTLSISVGVARREWTADPAGGTDADDRAGEALFRAADLALYGAKSRGRDQVFVASESGVLSAAAQ